MAAYPMPSCGVSTDSTPGAVDSLTTGRLGDGAGYGVSLWSGPKQTWTLVHDDCTWAEWIAILTSYSTNRALVAGSITFTWPADGLTKTTRWFALPTCKPKPNNGMRFIVTSTLEEV